MYKENDIWYLIQFNDYIGPISNKYYQEAKNEVNQFEQSIYCIENNYIIKKHNILLGGKRNFDFYMELTFGRDWKEKFNKGDKK